MNESKMEKFAKNNLRMTAAFVTVIVLCLALTAAYLICPGAPGKSKFMKFEGYIELPKSGPLNVLDYLAINNDTLFATSESSGALFKVDLDLNHPSLSRVSELSGSGAAHGVALMMNRDVAFITRSEENTVDVFDPTSLRLLTSMTVGTVSLPGRPEFPALDSQTGILYQNLEDIDSMVAVDLGKRVVIGQWSLAPCEGPSGMAIDAGQRRLFAVCSRNAMFVVFD